MSDELAEVKPEPAAEPLVEQIVFPQGDEMFVVARYPYQMQSCQNALKQWAAHKVEECREEVADLKENEDIAKSNGWATSALARARLKADKRLQFYDKIRLAIEAGYCIVPNFPVDIIAFRTKRSRPKETESYTLQDAADKQAPLPEGEGEFVGSNPELRQREDTRTDSQGKPHTAKKFFPVEFGDIEFPFAPAKPQVLSATARAMQDKFFDEIGVLPGRKKHQDPIVVGRIIDQRDKYTRVAVTFLIAWFLDTRDL